MAHANIFSIEWCDLVFEEKNKNYGAFDLRKSSSDRHLIAIIAASMFFISVIMITLYFNGTNKGKNQSIEVYSTMSPVDWTSPKDKVINEIKSIAEKQPDLRKTVKFTPPIITRDENMNEGKELKSQGELIRSRGLITTIDNENGSENPDAPVPGPDKQIAGEDTNEKPIMGVQQQPEFPGGMRALYQYFNENLRYPVKAQNNGIQGKVYVQFVVSKNGEITDIKILKGVEISLDQEALRLIAGMPVWKPGKNNGKPVATYFSLPVKFVLQDR
jgi:periplasmic protein TonB